MKITLTSLIIFVCSAVSLGQESENYILIVNGDSLKIGMYKEYNYQGTNGANISFHLVQPDFLTYSDEFVLFNHNKSLSVSNSDLGDGVEQCIAMNSFGNGFMVQKYSTVNPSSLTRLMVTEMTKESISYGYRMKERSFSRKLTSGHVVDGIQTTLKYKGSTEIYTVATYGEKDKGIIIATMLLDEETDDGSINLFWETLMIK